MSNDPLVTTTSNQPTTARPSALRVACVLLGAALGAGCTEAEGDPDAVLCEAAAADPMVSLEASPGPEDDAPVLEIDGVLREVALAQDGPRYLRVVAESDLGSLVALSAEGVLTALLLDGEEQPLSASSAVEACPEALPAHHDIDFTVGTWHLRLGPAAIPTVGVVAVSGVHGDEEHGR